MRHGKKIVIQTPYIICNRMMYADLSCIAQQSESICIVTNSVYNGATPWGCSDYMNQKEKIMGTGAIICEHIGAHSLHAKGIVIDDDITIIGSFNMDMRSTYLDTELMLVIRNQELNTATGANLHAIMEQGNLVMPDGIEVPGPAFHKPRLCILQRISYFFFRMLIRPIRHIL